jgi:hypothetical protein
MRRGGVFLLQALISPCTAVHAYGMLGVVVSKRNVTRYRMFVLAWIVKFGPKVDLMQMNSGISCGVRSGFHERARK